jgi:4-hydroxy-tetrahydrodipicolinate synthase
MSVFTGLSAFPLTPATEDGIVDTIALEGLVARLVDAGVNSIGLLGSTGIYAYLTRTERRRAAEVAVQVAGGRVPVMVGVGSLRTDDACRLARDAAELGADALLMAPVSYTPLNDDEVFEHYAAVARATDLPLCIYNNPGTTRFTFSIELLGRLAGVPRIEAVKMPLPAHADVDAELASLRSGPAVELAIGYSADWGLADAILAGADAFYSAVSGILPRETLALFRSARAGDAAEARRIDVAFQPLWTLFKRFGGLRVIYAIANQLSLCTSDPPRPILPLQARERDQVGAALHNIKEALA